MSNASNKSPRCPECGTELELAEGKAPGSPHVAQYASCTRCKFFNVARTPEHEAELKKSKRTP
jgi:hypothetical protein